MLIWNCVLVSLQVHNVAEEPESVVTALRALPPTGWASHARWLEQTLAQLSGAFQHSHGFKASAQKASVPLAPMPINLCVNVLDVQPVPSEPSKEGERSGRRWRAMHPTISVGAFAAHSLGFGDGGAAAYESRMSQLSSPDSHADDRASISMRLALAKRCTLLMCHAHATLAASFAASCQAMVAAENAEWFCQICEVGYLVQVESLLSTRGDEHSMLQDLQVACRLLSRVRIMVRQEPNDSTAHDGVSNHRAGAESHRSGHDAQRTDTVLVPGYPNMAPLPPCI